MNAVAGQLALRPGQWAGDEVWVVGTGPSAGASHETTRGVAPPPPQPLSAQVDLAALDARSARGEVRVIAVNHAAHDVPHADIVFSKDLSIYRRQTGCPTCCNDLPTRDDIVCVYAMCARNAGMQEWRDRYPGIVVLREWPRSGVGQCGPWPETIDDSDRGALVTCGNSGVGALCLADLLCGGDERSTIHLVGLDMDRQPYATWAQWFAQSGYAAAVRTRVVVHGDTALDPRNLWERAGSGRATFEPQSLYERLWSTETYRRAQPWLRAWKALAGRFGAGVRVVDVGCGGGGASLALAERGCEVTLVDVARNAPTPEAREASPFICASVVELPAYSLHWDWAWCTDVLEHLDPPMVAQALSALRAVASRVVLQVALFGDESLEAELGLTETLHRTVRPRSWWLDRIARYWQSVEEIDTGSEAWLTVVAS